MARRRLGGRTSRRRSGTEFGGESQENTIQPKHDSALSAGEKLRLGYTTQSDEWADAVPDPDSWRGFDPSSRQVAVPPEPSPPDST